MKIKYKIIEINKSEHSYIVRFYTDTLTEDFLALHLDAEGNIVRREDGSPARCRTDYHITMFNPDMTPKELERQIYDNAPVGWFKLLELARTGETTPSLTHVEPKLNVEHTFDTDITHAPLGPPRGTLLNT